VGKARSGGGRSTRSAEAGSTAQRSQMLTSSTFGIEDLGPRTKEGLGLAGEERAMAGGRMGKLELLSVSSREDSTARWCYSNLVFGGERAVDIILRMENEREVVWREIALRKFGIDQVRHLHTFGSPAHSPDGRHIRGCSRHIPPNVPPMSAWPVHCVGRRVNSTTAHSCHQLRIDLTMTLRFWKLGWAPRLTIDKIDTTWAKADSETT
jgi:hypothetical protein